MDLPPALPANGSNSPVVDDLFGIEVEGGLDFGSDDVLSCFGLGVDDHNWLLDSGNGDNLGLGFDDLEDLISSKDSSYDDSRAFKCYVTAVSHPSKPRGPQTAYLT